MGATEREALGRKEQPGKNEQEDPRGLPENAMKLYPVFANWERIEKGKEIKKEKKKKKIPPTPRGKYGQTQRGVRREKDVHWFADWGGRKGGGEGNREAEAWNCAYFCF